MRPVLPLAFALLGIALLLAAGRLLEPREIAFGQTPLHEGERVAIEGWVVEVRAGARGAALVLSDGAARLPLLVAGPPPADVGTSVRAVGIVARDGDGWMLSAESVTRLSAPRAQPVSAVVTALADGRPVLAFGTHREGVLREGDAGLPLDFPDARAPDGPLIAAGTLRLDPARAAFRLEVSTWTRG